MDYNLLISFLGTAIGTLSGIYFANKLTVYRLTKLEEEVRKHNNVIVRMFTAEQAIAVMDEKIKVQNHRIEDLEKK